MVQVDRRGGPRLPPELWQRILRCGPSFDRRQMKSLCLVCRLFAVICQGSLFQEVSVRANAGIDYKNLSYGRPVSPWRAATTHRWPMQEWKWDQWEMSMRSIITPELKLTLIGTHGALAMQLRNLTIRGYDNSRVTYPPDPFQPPSGRQMLSRAVFDALLRFRRTLLEQLPAFANLRRLELFQYPVDPKLLEAIDSHASLTELYFDFCWFPEATFPLISVTAIPIPRAHAGPSKSHNLGICPFPAHHSPFPNEIHTDP